VKPLQNLCATMSDQGRPEINSRSMLGQKGMRTLPLKYRARDGVLGLVHRKPRNLRLTIVSLTLLSENLIIIGEHQ